MALGFERKRTDNKFKKLTPLRAELTSEQLDFYNRVIKCWNFYEGYHWEDIPPQETPEITFNYCRAFVDKFVAFELGKAFTITTFPKTDNLIVTDNEENLRNLFEYLEDVWEDNNQYSFAIELGQMKSITSKAWVQVIYESPEDLEGKYLYNKYPNGRIRLNLLPTHTVFHEYDLHDRNRLLSVTVMYEYERVVRSGILQKPRRETVLYKQVWTKNECAIYDGNEEVVILPNDYGTIPFIEFRNLLLAGQNDSRGDLDDIIPLNTEYNLKKSNVSEVIDYHSSPITIVYGAKIGNLEKGANKLWGGIPKDAKVENLEMSGDGGLSDTYLSQLKLAMCEVSSTPETTLGCQQAISNTSGVALQYVNLPLIEKTRIKRILTEDGLERLNELIILVSLDRGLIKKPDEIDIRDFVKTEVDIPDTLPKDELLLLQQIEAEMKLGLESRVGALKRMGRENIQDKLAEIDMERQEHPELFTQEPHFQNENGGDLPNINSGITNGETAVEQVRKEVTGQNGGGDFN